MYPEDATLVTFRACLGSRAWPAACAVKTIQRTVGTGITTPERFVAALVILGGRSAGSATTLYFTAGPADESHGLFGDIIGTPEPGTGPLAGLGLLTLVLRHRQN